MSKVDKENLSTLLRCYNEIYSRKATKKSVKILRELANILIDLYQFSPNDEAFLGIWDEDLDRLNE